MILITLSFTSELRPVQGAGRLPNPRLAGPLDLFLQQSNGRLLKERNLMNRETEMRLIEVTIAAIFTIAIGTLTLIVL